jgi:hypothetical protein
MKWMKRFLALRENGVGDDVVPAATPKLTACYADKDFSNWWQGDVYPSTSFRNASLPNRTIPYWMLMNRTCQLFRSKTRKDKLPYHSYAATLPFYDWILDCGTNETTLNKIRRVIRQHEWLLFLPAYPPHGSSTPLIVNFNLIYSFSSNESPEPSSKLLQLSSPFVEHSFQKFANFFYTVGFDDESIKSDENLERLAREVDDYARKRDVPH